MKINRRGFVAIKRTIIALWLGAFGLIVHFCLNNQTTAGFYCGLAAITISVAVRVVTSIDYDDLNRNK